MELSSLANGWVESYLDALLSTGLSRENASRVTDTKKAEEIANAEQQICAKYYVQQILGLDEHGIKQAWLKASRTASSSSRLSSDKDARLEYLSWRVWHMRRKREVVEAESHGADAADEDEDYPGDEDEDMLKLPHSSLPLPTMDEVKAPHLRVLAPSVSESSLDEAIPSPDVNLLDGFGQGVDEVEAVTAPARYYVVMISLHGLVRGQRMELGRDPDTGGQVKYVVELAKAMSQHPSVHRVDLLTRLIRDPSVDESYGQEEECLWEGEGDMGGAYICRLPCGPPTKYLRKEALWPHLREFADRGISHVRHTLQQLNAVGEACELLAVHGHYADAGEAAALMAHTLGVDMLLTGHSLGRNKLDHLLKSGSLSRGEIESTYAISRRIEGEERAVDGALLVFTSTHQEVVDQWGLYDGYNQSLERAMRTRPRRGRRFPLMVVIPPGLDFSNLKVDLGAGDPQLQLAAFGRPPTLPSSPRRALLPTSPGAPGGSGNNSPAPPLSEDPPIWQEIFRFLRNPRKPVVLAMSRPDAKKNITTLVHAFGSCRPLRELANLVLVMGNRDVIDSMASGSQKVLEQVLKLVDAYDLYGSVAYPKHHSQQDISDIYLLPAATRGVFVNVALQEPFGLTLIEAAAHGVPIVATKNGGPVDIVKTLNNGILVNPTDVDAVASALLKIVTEPEVWEEYSSSGVSNINAYSWPSHCARYMKQLGVEGSRATSLKRFYSTYSGSFDSVQVQQAITEVAEQAGGSAPPTNPFASITNVAVAASIAGDTQMERFHSLPALASAGGTGAPTPPAPLTPLMSQGSHQFTDDLALVSQLSASLDALDAAALTPRSGYVVLSVDGEATAAHLAMLVAKHGDAIHLSRPNTGLAVMSSLSQKMTLRLLEDVGLRTRDLDFVICGCGSEIWYSKAEGTKLVEDTAYEEHIDVLWDRVGLKRMLLRLLATTPLLTGRGGGVSGAFRLRRDVGHYHLQVEIAAPSDAVVVKLPALIRKKLRAYGMRVQLTARREPGGPLSLHFTPLRATRAMALRYLAGKHDVEMEDLCVVVAAALEKGAPALCSSDGEDVVGGAQRVVVSNIPCSSPPPFRVPLDIYTPGRVDTVAV